MQLLEKLKGHWDLAEWFLVVLENAQKSETPETPQDNEQMVDALLELIYKAMKSTVSSLSHRVMEKVTTTLERIKNKEKTQMPSQQELDALLDSL
jgi:hypothetical protein